jgi:hypothetical protein
MREDTQPVAQAAQQDGQQDGGEHEQKDLGRVANHKRGERGGHGNADKNKRSASGLRGLHLQARSAQFAASVRGRRVLSMHREILLSANRRWAFGGLFALHSVATAMPARETKRGPWHLPGASETSGQGETRTAYFFSALAAGTLTST